MYVTVHGISVLIASASIEGPGKSESSLLACAKYGHRRRLNPKFIVVEPGRLFTPAHLKFQPLSYHGYGTLSLHQLKAIKFLEYIKAII